MKTNSHNSRIAQSLLALFCLAAIGCEPAEPVSFRANEVARIRNEHLRLKDGEKFDSGYEQQIGTIVTALFGTPDAPEFPFLEGEDDPAHDVISVDNLRMAAGAVSSDRKNRHTGLYREHCSHCHGITGDGAGATAGMLNPYPRDFRLGKFKFKEPRLGKAPRDEDLERILRKGIPGTGMPSFHALDDKDINALVDYVKYLSIRGEFERALWELVADREGKPLVSFNLVASKDLSKDDEDQMLDELDPIIGPGQTLERIVSKWLKPEKGLRDVPPTPASLDPAHPENPEMVRRGQELFHAKGNCVQCHGNTGLGDGQTENYDDWTNEWITAPRVTANDESTWQEFLDAGALYPRKIRPRNLQLPVYRGGGEPRDLYLRILNGIEGTPMPASPALVSGGNDDEIWPIVAWIFAMPYPEHQSAVSESSLIPLKDKGSN